MPETSRTVAIVTLGCARNEVDSEELAGRLEAGGWTLVEDAEQADVAVVNTCGFVEQAKKDSIDALLEASDLKDGGRTQKVVAVGCLAERYGAELAESMPEADAVLGFDSYQDMSAHLRTILDGGQVPSHTPGDRRRLLPLSPAKRQAAVDEGHVPGHASHAASTPVAGLGEGFGTPEELAAAGIGLTMTQPAEDLLDERAPASGPSRVIRHRLDRRPWAPLKIASGCDRRCSFCAIPSFRGSFVSRRPADVLAEARWLGAHDVREVFLVSENTTSYGKDLGDLRLLDRMLPILTQVEGIERVRVSYLQPAEVRPDLIEAMTSTPGVVPYFDLSFQHASAPLLRRMRRFGSADTFLDLLDRVRAKAPTAGIRSNVIVGFPGETEADLAELESFLTQARLDVIGVFGYSDEDGTEGETLDGHLPEGEVQARVAHLTRLVNELMDQRAEERIGETVSVLVEDIVPDDEDPTAPLVVAGRAEHQGPDVDGVVTIDPGPGVANLRVGDIVTATVTGSEGVDLTAGLLG